jgi:hypothetical protein
MRPRALAAVLRSLCAASWDSCPSLLPRLLRADWHRSERRIPDPPLGCVGQDGADQHTVCVAIMATLVGKTSLCGRLRVVPVTRPPTNTTEVGGRADRQSSLVYSVRTAWCARRPQSTTHGPHGLATMAGRGA